MSNKKIIGWVVVCALSFYILCIVGVCWSYSNTCGDEYEITGFASFFRGEIGDTFNIVTSLFGAAGTILLVWTLLMSRDTLEAQNTAIGAQQESIEMQREELKLQREELQNHRKEMSLTRLEFELSRATDIVNNQAKLIIDSQNNNGYLKNEGLAFFEPLDGNIQFVEEYNWTNLNSLRLFEDSGSTDHKIFDYLYNLDFIYQNSYYEYQRIALACEVIDNHNLVLLSNYDGQELETIKHQIKLLKIIFINSILTTVRRSSIDFDEKFGSLIEHLLKDDDVKKQLKAEGFKRSLGDYGTFALCVYLVQISRFVSLKKILISSYPQDQEF